MDPRQRPKPPPQPSPPSKEITLKLQIGNYKVHPREERFYLMSWSGEALSFFPSEQEFRSAVEAPRPGAWPRLTLGGAHLEQLADYRWRVTKRGAAPVETSSFPIAARTLRTIAEPCRVVGTEAPSSRPTKRTTTKASTRATTKARRAR